ncbi:hypothetical protein [Comamonas resistens]|uniref:hypothetical protein n=1 Tax=Comamonas resistens TaxID=3046670 RepID=UPI0039BD8168
MRWKNLSGPIIGIHKFDLDAVNSPDIVDVLTRAKAAGVHWSPVDRDDRAEFCLAPDDFDRWDETWLAIRRIHVIQLEPFKELLSQHETETKHKPLRDLLLSYVSRHELGRYRDATYRFTIQRNTAIHQESPRERLCLIKGASTSRSGAWFFEGEWSDTNESNMTVDFPASEVIGGMVHLALRATYFPSLLAKMIAEDAKAAEDNDTPGNKVSIGGDVGQSVAGDASFAAPVSFTVGKKKPKPD